MRTLAKLDRYDYTILPGCVQIMLDSTNDPIQVDILSEIDRANGNVYVDGQYFMTTGYDVHLDREMAYMNIYVTNAE